MRARNKPNKLIVLFTALAGLSVASPTRAAYTISIQQVGINVVAKGTGSLNLGSFTLDSNDSQSGFIYPPTAQVGVGSGDTSYYLSGPVSGPSNFGNGSLAFASLNDGGFVSFFYGASSSVFETPFNYASGADLGTSSSVYANSTFASLGITPGKYVYNFGTGATADSFTIQIGALSGAVPEPATWTMMLLAFMGIGMTLRRSKRHAGAVALIA